MAEAAVKNSFNRYDIVQALGSDRCTPCGSRKIRKRSHCSRCYYSLPPEQRQALYNLVGDGYEEAFIASLKTLGVDAELVS
ncbi:MAG: hypothetical protein ABL984_05360 [Pyrinomonadaceae bacterium]